MARKIEHFSKQLKDNKRQNIIWYISKEKTNSYDRKGRLWASYKTQRMWIRNKANSDKYNSKTSTVYWESREKDRKWMDVVGTNMRAPSGDKDYTWIGIEGVMEFMIRLYQFWSSILYWMEDRRQWNHSRCYCNTKT